MNILEASAVANKLNWVIDHLQHPFFMVVFGLLAWFSFLWSVKKDKLKEEGKDFWEDQKDEMVVTFIFGLLFLIFDDEMIQAYYDMTGKTGQPEMKIYYYLLVGPAVERLYWLYRKTTA